MEQNEKLRALETLQKKLYAYKKRASSLKLLLYLSDQKKHKNKSVVQWHWVQIVVF